MNCLNCVMDFLECPQVVPSRTVPKTPHQNPFRVSHFPTYIFPLQALGEGLKGVIVLVTVRTGRALGRPTPRAAQLQLLLLLCLQDKGGVRRGKEQKDTEENIVGKLKRNLGQKCPNAK